MTARRAVLAVATAGVVLSQLAVAGQDKRGTFIFENDMWGRPTSSDQNYTMGVGLVFSEIGLPDLKLLQSFHGGLAAINGVTGINRHAPDSGSETFWTIGSTNFTPAVLTNPLPNPDDRPYASLLYFGVGYSEVNEKTIVETELQLGILGTGIGRSVQRWIHQRCCTSNIPVGWDNQIGNGGSPTFLYHARWLNEIAGGDTFRLQAAVGGEAGYYVRGTTGLIFIFGATPADLGVIRLGGAAIGQRPMAPTLPSRLRESPQGPAASKEQTDAPSHGVGFAVWAEYEASAMLYNELLQGAWSGTNRVKFTSGQIQHFVQRASLGVDLTFIPKMLGLLRHSDFHIYFTQAWRSQDIKGVYPANHYWGGLTLSWACS